MKVRELIEKLLKLPQDLRVLCEDAGGMCFEIEDAIDASSHYAGDPVVILHLEEL